MHIWQPVPRAAHRQAGPPRPIASRCPKRRKDRQATIRRSGKSTEWASRSSTKERAGYSPLRLHRFRCAFFAFVPCHIHTPYIHSRQGVAAFLRKSRKSLICSIFRRIQFPASAKAVRLKKRFAHMPAQRLNCSFSLRRGPPVYGQSQEYIIENARRSATHQRPKKNQAQEALGFYGHGRRILAGKMNIDEVEAVTLPDGGKAIVSNIPPT